MRHDVGWCRQRVRLHFDRKIAVIMVNEFLRYVYYIVETDIIDMESISIVALIDRIRVVPLLLGIKMHRAIIYIGMENTLQIQPM